MLEIGGDIVVTEASVLINMLTDHDEKALKPLPLLDEIALRLIISVT